MKTDIISGGLLALAAAVFTASPAAAGPTSHPSGCPAPPRKVETTSGLVKGHPAEGAESVSEFLGIPYAQPPVDDLRWRPPVPYTSKSTINGTDYGFACWQPPPGSLSPEAVDQLGIPDTASLVLGQLRTTREQSEDCLTLNVWSKFQYDRKNKKSQKNKAVLVWVHGGSFETGSSSIAGYSGKYIAEQEDVVVVSLNYRLNIFGFPGNPVTEPNLGLLDLRLALEWVRDNIENFQGDTSRITIFGQSAGGALIDTYAYGWASDPIASGFIPMSGVAGGFDTPDAERSAETWFNISQDAGCGGTGDEPDAVSECMAGKSAAEILDAVASQDGGGAGLTFGPQPDGVRVFDDYSDRCSAEGGYLIGNTNNENGLFRIYSPDAPDEYWTAFDLSAFICPAADRASRSAAEGRPTWRYWYFGDFPNIAISTTPPSGAWHAAELPVLFDTAPEGLVSNTEAQVEIGSYFRGAWAAFAKDPQKGLLEYEDGWPAYDPEAPTLVRLAYDNQTGANLAAVDEYDALCASLADLVPEQ